MTIAEKIWNLLAPVYAKLRENPISGYFLTKEIRAIKSLLETIDSFSNNTVCDLGVGRGSSLNLIPKTVSQKFAIDKSMTMIKHTRRDFPDTIFISADVLNLPLKKDSFEFIICIGLAEYLPDLEVLVAQLEIILKNNGYIVLSYSPKNILTYLRFLRGHKIYARNSEDVEKYFKKYQLEISELKVTPMQNQYLLKKIS